MVDVKTLEWDEEVSDSGGLVGNGRAAEPDYVPQNRAAWESWAGDHVAIGRRAWAATELHWGVSGSSPNRSLAC